MAKNQSNDNPKPDDKNTNKPRDNDWWTMQDQNTHKKGGK